MKLRDGGNNKFSFLNFVIETIALINWKSPDDSYKTLIYLDNATYHTTSSILEAFKILKVNFIFAPPYCSPLNPIEYFFG